MKLRRAFWMLPASLLALGPARAERLRLADGTPVRLWLRVDLSSARAHLSDRVDFEVADPVVVQGRIVVPVGAVAWGAVQSVKEKEVKFDIEGVRLPNLQIVKLRTVREKTKRAGKDQIKVEDRVSDGVGAPAGAAFTAYLDEDAEVEVPDAAAVSAARPPAAAGMVPVPAEAKPAAATAVATPAVPPKETAVLPNPSPEPPAAPAAPSAAPTVSTSTPLPSAPAAPDWTTATEWVTIECFSEPSAADILIDGNFVGNTPSILKVPAGDHVLELKRNGYQPVSESMSLPAGTSLRTVRKTLQPKD